MTCLIHTPAYPPSIHPGQSEFSLLMGSYVRAYKQAQPFQRFWTGSTRHLKPGLPFYYYLDKKVLDHQFDHQISLLMLLAPPPWLHRHRHWIKDLNMGKPNLDTTTKAKSGFRVGRSGFFCLNLTCIYLRSLLAWPPRSGQQPATSI